jgi:paraquat-inducible protein B
LNKQINRLLVGIFCFGAIAILLGFAFFTGSLSFLRENNERFVLVFNENVYGLHEGSKVTFNGVRIGRVERFFLGEGLKEGPVPVQIEINRKLVSRHMVEIGNEIFEPNGDFKKSIIPRLVGQLSQESFVTGILYINLNTVSSEFAQQNVRILHGFREIHTKGSMFAELSESINLEKLSKQISELILVATQRLKDLDMKKVSSEFTTTSESLRSVLLALKESYVPLGKSLTGTSEQTQKTLLNLNKLAADLDLLFEPGSEFRFELDDTLRDVSGMAKSLKNLADLIERNPQAFIIGKPTAEE